MFGSSIPTTYYAFLCEPHYIYYYLSTLGILSVLVFTMTMNEKFEHEDFRLIKYVIL